MKFICNRSNLNNLICYFMYQQKCRTFQCLEQMFRSLISYSVILYTYKTTGIQGLISPRNCVSLCVSVYVCHVCIHTYSEHTCENFYEEGTLSPLFKTAVLWYERSQQSCREAIPGEQSGQNEV